MSSLAVSLLVLLISCRPEDSPPTGTAPELAGSARPFRLGAEGWQATLPDGATHAWIGADGLITDRGLRLRTTAWGRPGRLTVLPPVAPTPRSGTADPERLELAHEGVTEWWVAATDGLHQGWEVAAPPAGAGPVELHLAVTDAVATPYGGSVSLLDGTGQPWRYGPVAAWDADGTALPVRLDADGDAIRVVLDDTGARYPLLVDPLLTTASASLTGETTSSAFGAAVAAAGDVNGDGYRDVLVGSHRYSSYTGRAYLYYGGPGGLDASDVTVLTPDGSTTFYGQVVTGLGDVDGDGFDDIAVAAPGDTSFRGKVYVYLGSATGVSTTADLTLTGDGSTNYFGGSLARAGDLDQDGYDDVAIGAYGVSSYTGALYVYPGSSSGLSSSSRVTLTGEGTNQYFGRVVRGGGDIDGDGYPDLLVSAYRYSNYTGRVYVYAGSATGVATTATSTMDGPSTYAYFGQALAWAGDVDLDGYDDILVGAYGYDADRGRAELYPGSAAGLVTTPTFTTNGQDYGDLMGGSLAGLGDANADGWPDIAVSAHGYDNYRGQVYVWAGSARGYSARPDLTLSGATASEYFGYALAAPGDVDQDGFDDLVVGANNASTATGRVDLYLGYVDVDGDGWRSTEDCDDTDPSRNPGATERLDDGVDQDCDGTELCWLDADSDGYRPDETSTVLSADLSCAGPGEAGAGAPTGDCNDADPDTWPGAPEVPGDRIDQDCNGLYTCWLDQDLDGFHGDATEESPDPRCVAPRQMDAHGPGGDCDDEDATRFPGAVEGLADDVDQDCDGMEICFLDGDADGWRPDDQSTTVSADADCADPGEAYADTPVGDCDDTDPAFHPDAPEDDCADPSDYNCDGFVDYTDGDGDGAADCIDCDDADASRHPGATEQCNGQDDDCDGVVDSPSPADAETWYRDGDGDGAPAELDPVTACAAPEGYLPAGEWDCDDDDPAAYPGAVETLSDGIDQDCDGFDELGAKEPPGCGCAATPRGDATTGLLVLSVLGLLRRRRDVGTVTTDGGGRGPR